MDFLRDVMNPGWVSSAIGLLGVVAALLIYRASRVGARPVYQLRSLRLLGGDEKALPDEVEIRFKGQLVERLTKTHIVLWNSGRALLRGSDIVAADPLRCDFSEGSRVLSVRVLRATRATNKFEPCPEPSWPGRVLFTFDYLDPGDGAVVELLHTDAKRYPKVSGAIRGVPKGVLDWGRIVSRKAEGAPFPFSRRRHFLFVAAAVGLLMAAAGLLVPIDNLRSFLESSDPSKSVRLRPIVVGVGATYAALPLLLFWLTRRRFPRGLSTHELDE